MREATKARRVDDRSVLLESDELNLWTMGKLEESYHQAKQEDDQRKSIARQIMQKSTDIPEADHPASRRTKRCYTVVRVPSLSSISARRLHLLDLDGEWGYIIVIGGARLVVATTTEELRADSWLYRTARLTARRWFFGSTHHRRLNARISCVHSSSWPFRRRAGILWWTRSSEVMQEQDEHHE